MMISQHITQAFLYLKGTNTRRNMVGGDGFEPSKAVPADLQSAPFGHSGTPPGVLPIQDRNRK